MSTKAHKTKCFLFLVAAAIGACSSETKQTQDSGVLPDSSADSGVVGSGSYIYASGLASGFIRPEITIPAFGASMTGTYAITNTGAEFEEIYNGGGGTLTAGRLEGTLTGDTFTGYWYEAADESGYGYVQRTCDPEKESTRVYGRFTFTFSPDRRSFTGSFNSCEGDPVGEAAWTGTLLRRGQQ